MTVSSVNTASNTTPATSSATASGLTSAADQQDRFMTLLVAQMQNQDPLNPMDNAQMTTQIAQINTVAGIEKLNTTVEGLATAFNTMRDMLQARLPAATDAASGTTSSN